MLSIQSSTDQKHVCWFVSYFKLSLGVGESGNYYLSLRGTVMGVQPIQGVPTYTAAGQKEKS